MRRGSRAEGSRGTSKAHESVQLVGIKSRLAGENDRRCGNKSDTNQMTNLTMAL